MIDEKDLNQQPAPQQPEASQQEAPRQSVSEPEAPQPEAPKQEAPQQDTPRQEAQKQDASLPLSEEAIQVLASRLSGAIKPEKTEEEKRREEQQKRREEEARKQQEAAAAKLKRKKRRRKNLRNFILRLLLMVVVVYVLFFQIIGVTTMPNGDMYPRIDSGDLVIFYRLDKDVRAQDIVILAKDIADIQDFDPNAAGNKETAPAQPSADAASQAPVNETPVQQQPDTAPATIVKDTSFLGRLNQWVYDAERALGIRGAEGKQIFVCRVVAAAGDTVEITDDGSLIINGNHMIESNIFSHTTPYLGFTEYPLTLKAGECFVLADLRNGGADSRFFGPVTEEEILGTVVTIARRNNL